MNRRKIMFVIAAIALPVIFISWGSTGHKTVGLIAERHLTPQAKAAVKALLGDQHLADVANWPDEVRNEPEYKSTGPWHYIDLPLGLSYTDFAKEVRGQTMDNVYTALGKQEQVLGDKGAPIEKRIEALKFVVHFVGDLHQPMHVSRAEDKGGNTIQVSYNGEGTNLHALWDSKLIDHQGLSYDQLASKWDLATPAQVRQWQGDPLMRWIWESYEISTKLYAEVDAMKGRGIGEEYYQAHIGIIQQRIEQAGVRLAGILNDIFKDGAAGIDAEAARKANAASAAASSAMGNQPAAAVDIRDVSKHMNEFVKVCSSVHGYKALEGLTLVNLGAAHPDELLTVVLKKAAMDKAAAIDGKNICVTGRLVEYNGKPEIVVTDPAQITVSE